MGKYMKKSKITGDVAVMEVSLTPQCSLGVRTRAKTLALRRLQQQQQQQKPLCSAPSPAVDDDDDGDDSSFFYLELRSRRLEKPTLRGDSKKQNHQNQASPRTKGCCGENPSPNFRWASSRRLRVRSLESVESGFADSVADEAMAFKGDEKEGVIELGLEEASFGENNLEFEPRDRSTRESTPCSLIRESDTLRTPGSTTRRPSSTATNQRVRNNDMRRNIPTAHEMDEFFAFAEQQQQRIFIEKYNFDIVNDSPLPGRYEWVEVFP